MEYGNKFVLAVSAVLLMFANVAIAQDMVADDHADVWATIEGQWDSEEKGDEDWMEELLDPEFSGWPTNSPAPRSRLSTILWDRFADEQGKLVQHELYPLQIVVDGDVAIAHYLYTSAYEDNDDDVKMSNGRYTDILVRKEGAWKFIAWHGGDDDD